jgi:hypothetical protein
MACEQNGFFETVKTDDVVYIAVADEDFFLRLLHLQMN